MPLKFNSGALWGLVAIILLSVITMTIRKKRAERRWQKYGEGEIYRPDEWERKQGKQNKPTDDRSSTAESGDGTGDSGSSKSGSNVRRKGVQVKSDSIKQPDSTGNKKSHKANKQHSITIPSVEPVDEGEG